jgi:hypothetical protein
MATGNCRTGEKKRCESGFSTKCEKSIEKNH